MTQVRAIEILLRKCIPDLAAAEIKSEQTHRYVVEIPAVLTSEQMEAVTRGIVRRADVLRLHR
jgi:hypothetical protein